MSVAGIGFGLMYLPSIVMVSFYFDKRRALATGIAVCGSGVGTFVFAPFSNFLVTEYGWKVSQTVVIPFSYSVYEQRLQLTCAAEYYVVQIIIVTLQILVYGYLVVFYRLIIP